MDEQLQQCLENNIDLALSHGYTMSQGFSLGEKNGHYMPPDNDNLLCHPLETIVLGQRITAPINVDIAFNLGVHPSWVDGFLDGYGGGGYDSTYLMLHRNDPIRRRYTEGFDDGHEVEQWIINLGW